MACKPPIMANRKRPGTCGGNGMSAPSPASWPTPHPAESCDLKALPARQRPLRYHKETHDMKTLPHSCKAQYTSSKSQDVSNSCPQQDADADVEMKRYSNQDADSQPQNQRPETLSAPEHNHDEHRQASFHGEADSLDDDSSSDYINNSSEDEEDYDDGLAEEDEGVTYYIRYCPEDDSYLEGMDCSSQGGCNHSHSQGGCNADMPPRGSHTSECHEAGEGWTEEGEADGEEEVREEEWVEDEEGEGAVREEWQEDEEAVEEWTEGNEETHEEWREEGQVRQEQWPERKRHRVEEWAEGEGEVRCEVLEQDPDEQIYNGRPEPILDHHHHNHQSAVEEAMYNQQADREEEEEGEECCLNEEEDEEGDEHRRVYTGDYYVPEDNGNSVRVSPYRSRKVLVVEGETGEEAEEDIDQIVAEIKMSMSMGSLSSSTDQSPEELAQDPAPNDYPHSKSEAAYPPAHHRHDIRPKSLNLPSMHHNNPELQRSMKAHSPEDRQRWPQEQVSNGPEQPRKQQRSDLNVPLENNNVPEPTKKTASFPSFVDVPGPCEPEDLIDGIIFAANYLGSTQLLSERNPSKNIRMMQAQESVSRVKRVQKAAKIKKKASADGDAQTLTEVDLFISTQRIKVLNADTQETMMDNALRTISYIADIGNIVVLMARRRMPRTASQDCIETTPGAPEAKKQYKMICHVFESEDAQLIAQSIGQAFSVAYQEFLRANGINPEDLSQKEYSDIINTQEMYNDDLIHFSNSENCKELQLDKSKGEILGVVIVESGWGSILPTVILANMMNGGPAARSGKLSIGDQIMSINNTSLVGLPLATCQGIIKGLKNQVSVKMNIVSCPPVTTVLIKRPDLKYQLGFSVQNGIICSLMRGGIAERGGVRVGHRIIEINGQSVVATAHEKIVQALSNSVGEIHMKTMPAAMFRLLTGQETPLYI
ncbi:amyloid-beta A4 precursor protein-binding family A member 2 isoform X1 [Nothobranchius furzeri]|uniref:Amyloid beta (A4) precursor protein-binding, family A, member 2b n=1 Tax=Nothobranchius furzeri TaxID=105023 RepID=A0A1A8AWC5_NOTFU|nr:amyloid-beta A4 precursor protein-binding family A member 2 isoform X1 [Nothobranchius furzeri]XP_015808627.1 amyloid-beta A4 precursor protein-binding family A member 2 isoform X1 [Nothobranchius furzeri]XP_015808630.1 amyloid-beta A4 precursor protein-binding family A member 2 isoform X1 [Nothobranchius furzeri]KAF7212068.1 transcript variant X1 [Nothobranchius furzeri]KAF7212070.1 transcript variant X2 [Nothobranchius furzeri]KAF7212071.1 transcript variant X3 [Nothobranchius furzeri]